MANSADTTIPTRFHNLTVHALADEVGRIHAISKAAEAELKVLKEEFIRRGITEAGGDKFHVTATEQISGRLDAKAVRAHLGDDYYRFEVPVISTVIRVKAVDRLALAA